MEALQRTSPFYSCITTKTVCGVKAAQVFTPALYRHYPAFPLFSLARTREAAQTFCLKVAEAADSRGAHGKCLHLYSAAEYEGMDLVLDESGTAGFAIDQGRIVSMFCHRDRLVKGVSRNLLTLAIGLGGNQLDAFDTVLPRLYAEAGFRVVARTRWDDRYAPDGWSHTSFTEFNAGRPDIVFMVHGIPVRQEILVDNYCQGVQVQESALGVHRLVEVLR